MKKTFSDPIKPESRTGLKEAMKKHQYDKKHKHLTFRVYYAYLKIDHKDCFIALTVRVTPAEISRMKDFYELVNAQENLLFFFDESSFNYYHKNTDGYVKMSDIIKIKIINRYLDVEFIYNKSGFNTKKLNDVFYYIKTALQNSLTKES